MSPLNFKTMKIKYLVLFLTLLLSSQISSARQITLKITNENEIDMKFWYGFIDRDLNYYGDGELVSQRTQLGFVEYNKSLRAGRKASINQFDLKGGKIMVLFGIFEGGGHSEVKRFSTNDLKDDKLEVIFSEIDVNKLSKSYIKVVREMQKIGNVGEYLDLEDIPFMGCFFSINNYIDDADKGVKILIPSTNSEINKKTLFSDTLTGFFSSNAKIPLIDMNGVLYPTAPEGQDDLDLKEVVFPASPKLPELFGDQKFKFIRWIIFNSGLVSSEVKNNDYVSHFMSASLSDKKKVLDPFYNDFITNEFTNFKLYFIVSSYHTDSVYVEEVKIKKIEDSQELKDHDVVAPDGNYKLSQDYKNICSFYNVVKDIKAIDASGLMYYAVAKDYSFPNTLDGAETILSIYDYLKNNIGFPELDDKANSLTNPDYTISYVKNILGMEENIKKINNYFLDHDYADLDVNTIQALKAAFAKMK